MEHFMYQNIKLRKLIITPQGVFLTPFWTNYCLIVGHTGERIAAYWLGVQVFIDDRRILGKLIGLVYFDIYHWWVSMGFYEMTRILMGFKKISALLWPAMNHEEIGAFGALNFAAPSVHRFRAGKPVRHTPMRPDLRARKTWKMNWHTLLEMLYTHTL